MEFKCCRMHGNLIKGVDLNQVKNSKYSEEGVHCLCDIKNIHNFLLEDIETLECILCESAILSGANILSIVKHKFEPAGITIILLLSESHMSIHTYVDLDSIDGFGSAYIDFYGCGKNCSPEIGVNYLIGKLCSDEPVVSLKVLRRGLDSGIVDLSEMCEIMC